MQIIITKDNGPMGYVCYENEGQQHMPSNMRKIYVKFWTGPTTIKVYYDTLEKLTNEMKMFVGTPLAKSSEIHKAKEFMALDLLEYVSKNNK